MKRLICYVAAALLLLTCFSGCNQTPAESAVPAPSNKTEESFVKPSGYASVITVTINPEFRLYLDADGVVLAVEAVNADAKAIQEKITFNKDTVGTVVKRIVVAANEGGYVKADATVDVKVIEVTQAVTDAAVLKTVTEQVSEELKQLDVEIKLTTSVDTPSKTTATTAPTSAGTSTGSETTSTTTTTVVTTSNTTTGATASKTTGGTTGKTTGKSTTSQTTTTTQKPTCKHSRTEAVAVATGNNIIDASKLDAVYHQLRCKDCQAIIKTEKHTVSDGKCLSCGQSNLATVDVNVITAAVYLPQNGGHGEARVNENGLPNYEVMLQSISWDAMQKGEALDSWTVKVPEAVVLELLRTRFVVSDSLFAALKEQGEYDFYLGGQKYENGYFYFRDPAAGGPCDYSQIAIGYKDDKKGTFTVYIDYTLGGLDDEMYDECEHVYYYAVEYTYTGTSNLSLFADEYGFGNITGWKSVVESLRVKSIKKVTDLSGMTKVN